MQVIKRTLAIISSLSKSASGQSVSEIAAINQIPKTTVYRILTTLKDENYVLQDPDSKKYKLSYRFLSISQNLNAKDTLKDMARPHLEDLARQLKQTVTLNVCFSEVVTTIHFEASSDFPLFSVSLGTPLDLHASSAGKLFAAYKFMPQGLLKDFDFLKKSYTEYTIHDAAEYLNELHHIKDQGYALSDEELQIGVQGIACPVFNQNNEIILAISYTALKAVAAINPHNIDVLKRTCNILTQELGGTLKV